MIVLAAGDTLAGVASAASQVTCTIFGMELNAGTEAYKVLDQRQLASSVATIYTAPASTQAFVKSIHVVNNDTAVRTFQMFRGGTAAANAITPSWNLMPGDSAVFQETLGWQFFDGAGNELTAEGNVLREGVVPFYGLTGHLAESIERNVCTETQQTGLVSGTLYLMPIYLDAGTIVSNVSFCSSSDAVSPTHWLFGLYDKMLKLRATSADQTSTAWADFTLKTLAMTAPYLVPRGDIYYCAVMMTATTVVTLKGDSKIASQLSARLPSLGGSSTPGLVSSLPSVALPIAITTIVFWCSVS